MQKNMRPATPTDLPVFFYKKGAVGPPKAGVRSLAGRRRRPDRGAEIMSTRAPPSAKSNKWEK